MEVQGNVALTDEEMSRPGVTGNKPNLDFSDRGVFEKMAPNDKQMKDTYVFVFALVIFHSVLFLSFCPRYFRSLWAF